MIDNISQTSNIQHPPESSHSTLMIVLLVLLMVLLATIVGLTYNLSQLRQSNKELVRTLTQNQVKDEDNVVMTESEEEAIVEEDEVVQETTQQYENQSYTVTFPAGWEIQNVAAGSGVGEVPLEAYMVQILPTTQKMEPLDYVFIEKLDVKPSTDGFTFDGTEAMNGTTFEKYATEQTTFYIGKSSSGEIVTILVHQKTGNFEKELQEIVSSITVK